MRGGEVLDPRLLEEVGDLTALAKLMGQTIKYLFKNQTGIL
jgi:hypothetical protein